MLDIVRGLALVIMTVDHLPLPAVQRFTWEPLGFYSAAVVFVWLSGYVCGWRYSIRAEQCGWRAAWRKIVKRIAVLLGTFYALVVLSAAVCIIFPDPWFVQLRLGETIAHATIRGFLLQQTFYLPAVLKMYVYFLLLLLICIPLFRRGAIAYVVAVSFSGWACVQWFRFPAMETLFAHLGSYFHLLAWQFLFVVAAAFGYAKAVGMSIPLVRWRPTAVVAGLAFATAFALRHPRFLLGTPDFLGHPANDFHRLAWGSLASFGAAVLLYAAVPVRYKQRVAGVAVLKPIALLGRHSLAVFSAHIAVVYLVFALRAAIMPKGDTLAVLQWTVAAIITLPLFAVAGVREHRRTPSVHYSRESQRPALAEPQPSTAG